VRNVWILIKREYLERVRSRSFLIFTLLMPAIMAAIVLIPAALDQVDTGGVRHIIIVADNPDLAAVVGQELQSPRTSGGAEQLQKLRQPLTYDIQIDRDTSEQERSRLNQKVNDGQITGFIWLTDEALASHTVVYSTKEAADFTQAHELRNAISTATAKNRLLQAGMKGPDIDRLLTPVKVESVRVEKGREGTSGAAVFVIGFAMVMMLYSVVLIYGLAVMRSVIEEKSTRILEVLLSSVTAKELLAGKILGVGAVGLTQILVWAVFGIVFSTPGLVAAKSLMGNVHIPVAAIVAFGVFFLLGYLLYSSMYAAIGAMVNSDQEAQQMQWPALIPLVAGMVLMNVVIQHPNSALAFWLSMVPFFAPILMLLRILIEQPPFWEILWCVVFMLWTIYGLLMLGSRIYRVGILMYGKRPTWPELRRWIRYAG
jgi:ABC-2 type transport system permease protein